MPRVLICMPAYEPKREHITAAVESILAQTFTDWQLLIRDDCSGREDTESHIRPYLNDQRIIFRKNEKNLGIGGNWNACIQDGVRMLSPPSAVRAERAPGGGAGGGGEYVAFLFHDDLWKPDFLEASAKALDSEPRAGFSAAEHAYISEGTVPTVPLYDELKKNKQKWLKPGYQGREFFDWWLRRGLKPNVIGEPSFVVLRRSLMESVGPFNESMVQFLDCEYWARCLLKAGWMYLPQDLGAFRVHPSGMSAVNQRLGRGAFERFETLWMTANALPANEQSIGKEAVVRALSDMIRQYFAKRKEGLPVSASGSGAVKKFCLNHPILTGRAVGRVIWDRR
ncbi:MAG: glycosyltransferase [Candidatus Peribacteraceae bacterium]|nr:glycosyltransferase [Candidatus Peribacteraceae bacterium]